MSDVEQPEREEKMWSKDQPKVDGIYWWRQDAADSDPDIHFVQGEFFYQVGFASSEFVANFGGEWLGPIKPADVEAFIALQEKVLEESRQYDVEFKAFENTREAAEAALKVVSGVSLAHECADISHCEKCDACEFAAVAAQLRAALGKE